MRKCTKCNGIMKEFEAKTPENIKYNYYKCENCGEEVLDMKQLHSVTEQYRTLKKYYVRLSKWGLSLGLRIPKELVKKYKLKDDVEVVIIPENKGIKIIPEQ